MSDPESKDIPEHPASSGKSRMDREIEEILARSETPLPFPPPNSRPRRPQIQRPPKVTPSPLADVTAQWLPKLLAAPILLAVVAAILAVMIAGVSQLLANLLAFAAVAFVLLPIIQRFRSPSSPPESKMWRGQVIDPRSDQPSPISQIKRWWASQRR